MTDIQRSVSVITSRHGIVNSVSTFDNSSLGKKKAEVAFEEIYNAVIPEDSRENIDYLLKDGIFSDGNILCCIVSRERPQTYDVLSKPLSELDFSYRCRWCFERLQLRTVGGLVLKTDVEMLNTKYFGYKMLREVNRKLAVLGLSSIRQEVKNEDEKPAQA